MRIWANNREGGCNNCVCVCSYNCERVLWREMRVMTVGYFIKHE